MADRQSGENRKVHDCPACGGGVECGMVNGEDECWCSALPNVLPMSDDRDAKCYCRACLEALIRERARRQLA